MPAKVDDKKVDRKLGHIYIGIGGWNFEPWRGVFYPKGLPQAKELEYAASHLTSIEINATFYGSQKPESFRKWAATVPNGFVFSVKGPRFATNRRVLAEAGDSIKRFLDTGVLELGDRLGPLLWQFAPTKKFDPADFGKFLELLPAKAGNTALRHVVEVRHPSFCAPASSRLRGAFISRSCSPITRGIRRSPTRPAISSTRACKKARTRYRPPIRPRSWMPGPNAWRFGRRANRPTTCRISTPQAHRRQPHRVTCLPMSFTKGRYGHPLELLSF